MTNNLGEPSGTIIMTWRPVLTRGFGEVKRKHRYIRRVIKWFNMVPYGSPKNG